jgi:hypothetical protein
MEQTAAGKARQVAASEAQQEEAAAAQKRPESLRLAQRAEAWAAGKPVEAERVVCRPEEAARRTGALRVEKLERGRPARGHNESVVRYKRPVSPLAQTVLAQLRSRRARSFVRGQSPWLRR